MENLKLAIRELVGADMRYRIYPVAAAAADATPPNKYAGMREEIAAYKAAVQLRKRERLAAEAAAAAAAAAAPRKRKQRLKPNAFASTFKGLVSEYCSYWSYMLKTFMTNLKREFIPTICCLRAEIRTGN